MYCCYCESKIPIYKGFSKNLKILTFFGLSDVFKVFKNKKPKNLSF